MGTQNQRPRGLEEAQLLFPTVYWYLHPVPKTVGAVPNPVCQDHSTDREQGAPCRKEVGPGLRIDQKQLEIRSFRGFWKHCAGQTKHREAHKLLLWQEFLFTSSALGRDLPWSSGFGEVWSESGLKIGWGNDGFLESPEG